MQWDALFKKKGGVVICLVVVVGCHVVLEIYFSSQSNGHSGI